MTEIILLVIALFIAPYILIAILWTRLGRLERQLRDTNVWFGTHISAADGAAREQRVDAAPAAPMAQAPDEPAPVPSAPVPEPATPPRTQPSEVAASLARTAAVEEETLALKRDEPAEPAPAARARAFDFEDIFGRRLPIWAGGIALAIAGIFLVRYSIEAGLITPVVRVALSFVFGITLIAGAEAAYRFEATLRDPRVRQALAGAGIATLFGAFYLAGSSYGLIGAGAAFLGLAAVTAAAIALSFRFGLPCAILGLLGGFAAPVMVESDSANIPLLALYLALVAGGLAWTGARQGRSWLGYAALAAGLGWGVAMQLIGLGDSADVVALGVYLVVLGTVLPAFLYRQGGPRLPQLAAAGIATLQMAVLVSNAGFDLLTWGQYLLIAGALAILGWRFPALRPASGIAALVALFLLGLWRDPSVTDFTYVTVPLAAIFAGVPLAHVLRRTASLIETTMLAIVPVVLGAVAYVSFGAWDAEAAEPALAGTMAALGLFPLAGLAARLTHTSAGGTALSLRRDLPMLASLHALAYAAALLVTPAWLAPVAAAMIALAVLALLWKRSGLVLLTASWAAIAVSLLSLIATPDFGGELLRLGGEGAFAPLASALLRWSACLLPLMVLGALRPGSITRHVADAAAALIAYGAMAQIVPGPALAWFAALACVAIVWLRPERVAGWSVPLAIAAIWAMGPALRWAAAGAAALAGEPFLSHSAIAPLDLAQWVTPAIAASAVAAWRLPRGLIIARRWLVLAAGLFGAIALHSLYKQVWGIASLLRFEHHGLGERTVWQALLVLASYSAARVLPEARVRLVRIVLLALALGHFAWFTLVLHNPLLLVQHVGPVPLFNWLLAAYGTAIAALVLLRVDAGAIDSRLRWPVDGLIMLLIALLAVSELRQVFAGSALTATAIGQTESLLLSLLGIALALGFLWWGSFKRERSWRIGSLVLMLGAVGKVFLIDAAGLEGLLRVASFMALGFSLIGIGWVYARQLARAQVPADP